MKKTQTQLEHRRSANSARSSAFHCLWSILHPVPPVLFFAVSFQTCLSLWSPPASSPLPAVALPPAFGVFLLAPLPKEHHDNGGGGGDDDDDDDSDKNEDGMETKGKSPGGVVVCFRGASCGASGGQNPEWLNDVLGEKDDVASVAEAAQR